MGERIPGRAGKSFQKMLYETINNSDYLVFAIPSAFLCESLKSISQDELKGKTIISAIKGIVPEHNKIIAEFFNQVYGVSLNNFVVVSGPSHAEEIALEKLTYLTVASQDIELSKFISSIFKCRFIQHERKK